MIKVNKTVEITIDGKDIQTLTNICEITRIALAERGREGFNHIDETRKGGDIDEMLEIIFDA